MNAMLTATCDRALDAGTGTAPDWVHLLPLGAVEGRDGRAWVLDDPQGLVSAFNAGKIDLPVDYEHQNDKPEAGRTGPVPAAGWIKELKVAANGLWGRVVWTARASELISAKEYRYISPVFHYLKDGSITRLKGAGLVHNPNLELTALAAQEDAMKTDMTFMQRLATTLKLAPDATADAILAALEEVMIKGATPDPKEYAPVAAMAELLRDRNTRIATMSESAATAKVDDALRKGYITPAMRGWATALCAQDPDSFDTFLTKSAPAYAHLTQSFAHMKGPPPAFGATATGRGDDSDAAAAICAQLGLPPGSLNV